MTPPVPQPAVDVLAGLRTHLGNLTLVQLGAFVDDLQAKVNVIHSYVPPDSGPVSSNPEISRIETALKLARGALMLRQTQNAPIPPDAATVINSVISQLNAIDQNP